MVAVDSWAEVGERVRSARVASGLTQGRLAQHLGVDRSAMVRIEAGDRGVSALELSRMAEALDIPIAHFVSRSPGPVAAYRAAVMESPIGGSEISSDRTRFLLDVELETHARDAEWLVGHGFLTPTTSGVSRAVASRDDALQLARDARRHLGNEQGPIGSLATTSEKFGLYMKVVPKSTAGASLHLDAGFGVAVVGEGSDPGRRRATAAHGLGHHLFGDKYNSDAGVAASDRERERLIDAFVSEFLLPDDVVRTRVRPDLSYDEFRESLVALSGEYRLSWTPTVSSAQRLGLVDPDLARRLATSTTPGKAEFVAVLGYEPGPDLVKGRTGPDWRRAVLAAWKARKITEERTRGLLNDYFGPSDPLPDQEPAPEDW